jgi:hypothetical protein
VRAAKAASVVAGAGTFLAIVVAALFWRVEVRHSSPYGFSKTVDFSRLIAVPGGYVTANYPNFDRLDLDLRAYQVDATYDLTVHVKPAIAGAVDVRTIRLDIDGTSIPSTKATFGNPFTTVSFEPIPDSTGKTYYVWVERGPRNRDDVVTVWSIKSYSRVTARQVVAAMLDRVGKAWGFGWLGPVAAVCGLGAAVAVSCAVALLVWIGCAAHIVN